MNRFLSICRFDNNGAWWGDADGSVLFSLIGVNSMFLVGSWISLVWMDWDCLGGMNERMKVQYTLWEYLHDHARWYLFLRIGMRKGWERSIKIKIWIVWWCENGLWSIPVIVWQPWDRQFPMFLKNYEIKERSGMKVVKKWIEGNIEGNSIKMRIKKEEGEV